jgi:hypothetical protein
MITVASGCANSRFVRISVVAIASLLVATLVFSPRLTAAANNAEDKPDHQLSPQEWRQDLHFLAEQMRLEHKSLFHTMSETQFKEAVEKLDADISRMPTTAWAKPT